MNFDSTITEADFKHPLIDPSEVGLMREVRREPDLAVDGLSSSLLSWLAAFLTRRPRP